MINHSRRKLIKTLGYGIALSAGGASTLAIADNLTEKNPHVSQLPLSGLSICQQQSNGKEIVSIMNLSDKSVALDAVSPVSFEDINGSIAVKLNPAKDHSITIYSGERFVFEVESINETQKHNELQVPKVLACNLKMTSEHPAFNGVVPVTAFDSIAA